jgi:hypothetical protein
MLKIAPFGRDDSRTLVYRKKIHDLVPVPAILFTCVFEGDDRLLREDVICKSMKPEIFEIFNCLQKTIAYGDGLLRR